MVIAVLDAAGVEVEGIRGEAIHAPRSYYGRTSLLGDCTQFSADGTGEKKNVSRARCSSRREPVQ